MTLWFQSILAVVLMLICIFLILLLRQLQRTAASIQQLAKSVQHDLRQVVADIHDLKNHTDKVLLMATDNLGLSLNIKNFISKATQTMDLFLPTKHLTWLEIVFTNVRFAHKLIRKFSKKTNYK